MKKVTTWRPDTCDCEIEYEWDTDDNQTNRVHTFKQANKKCQFHVSVNGNAHWNQVLDENQTKNKVEALVLENFSELIEEVINSAGDKIKRLKPAVQYKWSFNQNRKLEVDFTGMDNNQRITLKNLCDTNLGLNKVIIK